MTENGLLAQMLLGAQGAPNSAPDMTNLAGILLQRDNNRRKRADYHAGRQSGPEYGDIWDAMHPMDKAALATAPIPGVGDVVGIAADARALYSEPSWTNAGMMALGALPLVPAAGVLKRGADAADAATDVQLLASKAERRGLLGLRDAYAQGNLRDRYKWELYNASGGRDPRRIKLTPKRIEASKNEMLSNWDEHEALRKAMPAKKHLEDAKVFAAEASRNGRNVRLKMPDGPNGSIYVRVGDEGTVRFADHPQPTEAGEIVGGYSQTLGRRHHPATLSVDPRGLVFEDAINWLKSK